MPEPGLLTLSSPSQDVLNVGNCRDGSGLGSMLIFSLRQIFQAVPESERGGHSMQLEGLEALALQPFQVWTNSKNQRYLQTAEGPNP